MEARTPVTCTWSSVVGSPEAACAGASLTGAAGGLAGAAVWARAEPLAEANKAYISALQSAVGRIRP
jgi:hypothetical protein